MPVPPEHRSLLMRSNRLLGANLVEANLIKIEQLEAANERLLALIGEADLRQTSLLSILAYEQKVLKEEDVLLNLVEEHGLGLIDLRTYDMNEELRRSVDAGVCWATWTIPFDREEGVTFVASAYYLSPAVRAHWEKLLETPVLWYGTTMEIIADTLEKIESSAGKPSAS